MRAVVYRVTVPSHRMGATRGVDAGRSRPLFISWTEQSRSRSLAASLGADHLVPAQWMSGRHIVLRYIAQSLGSFVAVLRRRPSIVLFANPPCVAGAALLLATKMLRTGLWCDCHSGAFNDPRWKRFAWLNSAVLKSCDGVIFHNRAMADAHREVNARLMVVSAFTQVTAGAPAVLEGEIYSRSVVVPCSYEFDEPIDVLFGAAHRTHDITWILTGTPPSDLRPRAPANVTFTGWLSEEDYDRLIARAGVVVCLTTRENTMQNGLVEAISAGRPVVTSSTEALVEWCARVEGTTTVANESGSLAAAVAEVLQHQAVWTAKATLGQRQAETLIHDEVEQLIEALNAG